MIKVSVPKSMKIVFYDDPPLQGLSEARRCRKVFYIFLFFVIDPPRGRPFGSGGVYRIGGVWGSQPHMR